MQNSLVLQRRRTQLKGLIETAGARFVRVDFVKKDGSLRKMIAAPKARTGLVGEAASESAKRAVETRKANNPNLVNIFDTRKKGWRSINLDTVYAVQVDGTRYVVLDGLSAAERAAAERGEADGSMAADELVA